MTPAAEEPTRPDEETETPPEEQAPQGLEPEPTEAEEAPGEGPQDEATVMAAAGGDSPPDEAVAPGAEPEEEAFVRPRADEVDLKLPLLILFGPVILLAIGSLLFPEAIWEGFVKKYYWDPIVTDAGFTTVNTASWALLMGAIIFLLWRVVQKIEQPVTFALIMATVPYMAAGSITRVLEDTGFFVQPLRYLFITPIIYVLIVTVAVMWIVIGHLLKRHAEEVGPLNAVKALAAFFGIVWLVYTVWSFYGSALADFGNPLVLLLAFVVPLAYFWNYTKQSGRFSQVGVMATFGMAYLLYAIYYVVLWHTGNQWEAVATDKNLNADAGTELRPLVYLLMIILPALFVGAVYGIAKRRYAATGGLAAFAYLAPTNLFLVFAQMMDAAMTSLGIDAYGYTEKHVLPAFLIGWTREAGVSGTGDITFRGNQLFQIPIPGPIADVFASIPATLVMIPIKLAVALLVVWAIDVYAREDVKRYPDLVGLAKMAIIMVGLAPGVRDAVRLAMDT